MPKRKNGYSGASASKRQYTKKDVSDYMKSNPRKGFKSVPRARGAAVTGEMKYFDADYSPVAALTAVTTTWPAGTIVDPLTTINLGSAAVANPLCLFDPTVGAGLNQRIGRKVKVMKIKLQGTFSVTAQAAQAAADSACKIRLALVQDCQTNAAQMTSAALFNDGTAASTVLNSFQNPNNFGRFRVLKQKMFCISNLNLTGSPTTADVIQTSYRLPFKFNVNFKTPVLVNFNATNGGTVADIIDNSFHVICGTDNAAYGTTISYYSRVAFKE